MLGEGGEARALGEILPQQTVWILRGAALPGVIGRSKVEACAGGGFDVAVAVELSAVVDGDRPDTLIAPTDEFYGAAVRVSDGA